MSRRYSLILLFVVFAYIVKAQDNEPGKWAFKGYLKNMSTFSWSPYLADTLWYDNLTHNRLNLAWYPNDEFSVYVEMRNRLFMGSSVGHPLYELSGGYGELINSNDDFFTLSFNAIDNEDMVLNIMFDRLYVQWAKNNWEVKLGRQRINWGINAAWNPNDWFNAYSFFDFDYEERPGSDALRVTYYTGVASSVEVAAKIADSHDDFVAASMFKMNKNNYDIQFLGGYSQGDLSVGTGWAGNLGLASFKGELSYFHPLVETNVNMHTDLMGNILPDSVRYENMFLGTVSVDYSFKSSLYLNGSIMYSSLGDFDANILGLSARQQLGNFTVRDLSPYPWSAFVQSMYQFTPLLIGGGAVMFYPGTNQFFINPYITYSLVQNLDLDLVGQVFYGDNQSGSYDAISKAAYLRVKWSF
ncbi:MAG: hypothetical protein ABFS32_16860 [Bacteroidota bacterium]